jgi:hypothetical protein
VEDDNGLGLILFSLCLLFHKLSILGIVVGLLENVSTPDHHPGVGCALELFCS